MKKLLMIAAFFASFSSLSAHAIYLQCERGTYVTLEAFESSLCRGQWSVKLNYDSRELYCLSEDSPHVPAFQGVFAACVETLPSEFLGDVWLARILTSIDRQNGGTIYESAPLN